MVILGGKEVTNVLDLKTLKPKKGDTFPVVVGEVYDGDTFYAIYENKQIGRFIIDRFRVARIDAPEMKKKRGEAETPEQALNRKELALNAKHELMRLIGGKPNVMLSVTGQCPYGRPICEVVVDGINVSDYLLEKGIVDTYKGK